MASAVVLAILAFASLAGSPPVEAQPNGEVRALWVDAFHDGFKSPAQVEKLVADARRANVNTLIVQVRRRGDVYYLGGPEPLASDQPAAYDALRTLLDAARRGSPRLEVHAWVPGYTIWSNRSGAPTDPSHVFNRHGPTAPGDENWLMLRDDGETWVGDGYWLDPGHPAVADYLVSLTTDLVQRYDVDGLHLDRFRYHEGGRRWGYNPASVIRFAVQHGRPGNPDPNDPLWSQFRRDQLTETLRRIRESALAARPGLKLSAAVIPWGNGPLTEADWQRSDAYASVFQDWRAWLEQGLLDQAYLMVYYREHLPEQATMLDRWLSWGRRFSYGRQVIAGLAPYLNAPGESVKQVRRALAPTPEGRLAGVALYSYASPDPSRVNADPSDDTPDGLLWDLLTRPVQENDFSPPFASPASVPSMSWRR